MTQPKRGLGRGLDALFASNSSLETVTGHDTGDGPAEESPAPAPPASHVATALPQAAAEQTVPQVEPEETPPAPAEDASPAPSPAEQVHDSAPMRPVYRQPEAPYVPPPTPAPVSPSPGSSNPPAITYQQPAYQAPAEQRAAPENGHTSPAGDGSGGRPAFQQPGARPTGSPADWDAPAAAVERPEPEPAIAPAVALAAQPPAPGYQQPARRGPDHLDIDLIAPNPEQPRTHFEPEKLRELSDSIREHGIIQPLIVSRDEAGGYRLIAGERRLQAARLAGLINVPVVIREASDTELLELALIENIQRADLNPIEEAMAYRRLTEEYALTQEEAAKRVGKSRVAVANALRLLQLENEIRRSLVGGEITEGHARALLGLPEGRGRVNAWREVVKRKLSVRDTEGYVRRTLTESPATSSSPGAITARRDSAISDIEGRLRRALSTRVTVQPQKKGARILIECYSSEEFENVVATLLGEYS